MTTPASIAALPHSDAGTAVAVRWALEWDAHVDHERVQVIVSDGWVTLDGSTDTLRQREAAERAALSVSGVRGVTNHIAVVGAMVSPATVQTAIAVALARRADQTARQVRIEVDGAVVTLGGSVHTWHEKQAILDAVRHTPGVHEVKDQLRIIAAD